MNSPLGEPIFVTSDPESFRDREIRSRNGNRLRFLGVLSASSAIQELPIASATAREQVAAENSSRNSSFPA
jgi:hypothetical protein